MGNLSYNEIIQDSEIIAGHEYYVNFRCLSVCRDTTSMVLCFQHELYFVDIKIYIEHMSP